MRYLQGRLYTTYLEAVNNEGEPNLARSLKERYEARMVEQLKERVVVLDKRLIEENRVATILLEAMDQEDLDKVSAIIQKLDVIKDAAGDDLQPLTASTTRLSRSRRLLTPLSGGSSSCRRS
mgnify:CR=1 FL=1